MKVRSFSLKKMFSWTQMPPLSAKVNRGITPERKSGKEGNHT